MKTIGLIGGMSWESSAEYYRIINEKVKEKLGGLHSARCLMVSVDFAEVESYQQQGEWGQAAEFLIDAAMRLERGGADFLLICTNTMHKVADDIQQKIQIPILHIVDATAEKVKKAGHKKIGLLGTKFTMEEPFYKDRLAQKNQLEVIIPEPEERAFINQVIFKELCLGILQDGSRSRFINIIENLSNRGAEAVILGCTEIPLLVKQVDFSVPLFDTTAIHAEAAVEYALAE
jgi:aspartate racemase